MSDGRTLFTVPRPELCRALQWSLSTSRTLEALGLDPAELIPSPTRGGVDLRPREFACPWAKVRRRGPGLYMRWGRIVASEAQMLAEPSDVGWGSSILIAANFATDELEQAAGDEVLRQTAIGSGAHGQALREWLELWGWKPPVKGKAAAVPQPMVT
jgi:hypothetical protein